MEHRLSFSCDYLEGAHPAILQRLCETNFAQTAGYGTDEYCESAREKIRAACGAPNAEIHFLVGGTQTNATVIDALLRPYEGVVASSCGHVNTHEAGAIESTGHKVLTVPHRNGKLDADDLREYIETFYADESHNHMVFPGMVYISHPSEYGTLYTKNELERISAVCKAFDLPLFLDGARLGYGLTADTDVTLPDIARLTDVFYIGGTKCGALCGEAVVFTHGNMPRQFETMVKRHGAMVAKGRLNAVQFDALFTDGLYEKICAPAVRLALKLRDGLAAKGYRFAIDSPTNQQFIIVENSRLPELGGKVAYSFIEKYDAEHTVIRLATSWATTEEQVDELLRLL